MIISTIRISGDIFAFPSETWSEPVTKMNRVNCPKQCVHESCLNSQSETTYEVKNVTSVNLS